VKITNVSPVGALHIAEFAIEVQAGETIDVPDALAATLLRQTDNFRAASATTKGEK
jgi:hypothetical protein